ncbi:MAG: RIP metalloprotease RseP [Lentisphaerae bacterium]|nr:RIP metalloprotease RseP [Lentisphaerota bacterium]
MNLLTAIAGNVYVALAVIAFFGVTIFVHELGHFIVARLCGMVVKVFSIGFGPALWQRKRGGIVYKIGAIPFGGYVALPQLDPAGMTAIQGPAGAADAEPLPRISPGKKILVSLAGASGNVLLAVGIAWLVYWVGMPWTTANEETVAGYVAPDSEAYAAGMRTGDRIVAVNGVSVETWGEFIQEASMAGSVVLALRSPDRTEKTITVTTEECDFGVQMVAGVDSRSACEVDAVSPGMSAARAGMEPGDVLVEFAGTEVLSRAHLVDLVEAHRDETVAAVVERTRDGQVQRLTLDVTPQFDPAAGMPRIGIEFKRPTLTVDVDVRVHPQPSRQLRFHTNAIFRFLRGLLTPRTAKSAARQVGGPVAIVKYYVVWLKASLMLAVFFTGFLNVNLAIINLLPLPVLDGGHIVFSLWEGVTRRPVHARVVNILVNVFSVLIIGVFVLISIRDIDRFTPLGRFVRGLFQREQQPPGTAP